jgi:hypothetical protein
MSQENPRSKPEKAPNPTPANDREEDPFTVEAEDESIQ